MWVPPIIRINVWISFIFENQTQLQTSLKHKDPLQDLTARPPIRFMKTLSWSTRGLGKPVKRHLVKDVIISS